MDQSREARLARALVSLEGLSVGDAFGERFFVSPSMTRALITERALAAAPWPYTDDTQMALSLVETLSQFDVIDQEYLAGSFGRHYDISRGYGPAMHQLLVLIRSRKPWRESARGLFGGQGSFGNGSAMRVAPLGAYFADDLDTLVEQAARSAEVTHAHTEASAGAIAVALAAAEAWRRRGALARRASDPIRRLSLPASSSACRRASCGRASFWRLGSHPTQTCSTRWKPSATAGSSPAQIRCPSRCGAPRVTSTVLRRRCGRR